MFVRMRFVLSFLLAVMVVLGSSGFRLNRHYCCGDLVDMQLTHSGHAGGCEEQDSMPSGCCDDETQWLSVDKCKSGGFVALEIPDPIQLLLPLTGFPFEFALPGRVFSHQAFLWPEPKPPPAFPALWLRFRTLRL